MQLYNNYVDYFRNIAATHPWIIHQATIGNKAFCISIEEALTSFRTNIREKGYFMRLIQYTYTIDDNKSQNSLKHLMGGFIIAKHHKKDDFDDMVDAIANSERIVDEIVERMVADSRNGHPLFYHNFDRPENVSVNPWHYPVDSYSGWICTFEISNFFRNCITDPKAPAWTDGGLTPF